MKTLVLIIGLTLSLNQSQALANAASTSLVDICKNDCPKAKNDEETHKCAEKKGRLNKEFRKSACWEANEEYEKKAGKTEIKE